MTTLSNYKLLDKLRLLDKVLLDKLLDNGIYYNGAYLNLDQAFRGLCKTTQRLSMAAKTWVERRKGLKVEERMEIAIFIQRFCGGGGVRCALTSAWGSSRKR